jgi:hypothetical protein
MTKRLQVLFEDDELMQIQETARRRRQTVAAWVRDVLRAAQQAERYPDPAPKLRAVREAATYGYPTGDIEEILGDIERGYVAPPDA